ncbi:hypothetical protein C8R43DRAFT_955398 [Mycena crocata]|nr:hypothetical protein C8R43DRAFT_955398 [Mycena crocata]
MAMHWKSHSYENDTVERCDRSANDDMIGVYLNGRQISAPFVNWYLTLGVPCFYVIDVVHKPLPEPIHLSFSAGTPIQALMSGSTYLYDFLANRDGCKVAAEGFRWPGDKWTMQRIATMRKYLVSRYPKHFIPHEHLPDPQSASMLKRINEKKRRPPSEVIRCMRPQQPQRREPEVESDSGSTESDSEGRDTDSQSDSGESESDSVGRDTDSQSDSGRNIAHSPSQSGSNIEADEDRTPDGNPPKDTAPSPELGSNVEADEDGTRDGNPPKDTAPSPELGFLYPQNGKGAVQITMKEFDILRSSKRFLNDKVVDFFLRKFEAVQRWTNAISGLYTQRIILFPINLESVSHWFLAIFNPSEAESRLWVLDSMGWKNRKAVTVLLDYLQQEAAAHNAKVKPPIVGYVEVPKQLGNVLCGDNVIHFASMFLQKPDFYLEKFKEDISTQDMWKQPSNNLRVWLRSRMDEVINNDYPHLRPALAPFTPTENEIIELDDSDDPADDQRPGPASTKDKIVKLDSDVADDGKPEATWQRGKIGEILSAGEPTDALRGVDEDISCGQVPSEDASSVIEATEDTMDMDAPASIANPSPRSTPVPNDPIVTQKSDALRVGDDEDVGCGPAPSGNASSVIEATEDTMDVDALASIANPSPRSTPLPNDDPIVTQKSDALRVGDDEDVGCGPAPSGNASSVIEATEDTMDVDALASIANPSPRSTPVPNDPIVTQKSDALRVGDDEDVGCGPAPSGNASSVIEATEDTMDVDALASIANPSPRSTPLPNDDPIVTQKSDALRVGDDEDVGCGPAPSGNASSVIEATEDTMDVDALASIANPSPRSTPLPNDDPIVTQKSDALRVGDDEDVGCGPAPSGNASSVIEATEDTMDMDAPASIANPIHLTAAVSSDNPTVDEEFNALCVADEDIHCGQVFPDNTTLIAEPEEAAPVLIANSPHVVPLPSTDRAPVCEFDRRMGPVDADQDEAPTVDRNEARALDKGKGPAVWAIFKTMWQNVRVSFNSDNRTVYPSVVSKAGTAEMQALTIGSPRSLSPLQAVHCDLIPSGAILQPDEMTPTGQHTVWTTPTGPRAMLNSSDMIPIPTGPRAMLQPSNMFLIPTGPRAMLQSSEIPIPAGPRAMRPSGTKISIPTGPRAMLQPGAKLSLSVPGVKDGACASMSPMAPTAPRRLSQADPTMAPADPHSICGPSSIGSPLKPPSALVVRQLNIGRDSRRQHTAPYTTQQGVSANLAQEHRIRFPRPRAGKQHREQQWVRNNLAGFK